MRRLVATLVIAAASLLVLPAAAGAGVRSDFNGDGFEDLAIGIEGEDPGLPDSANSGAVEVIYGSATNLDPIGPPADQFWHEGIAGVRGEITLDDGFGDAVAAGDFDGDGIADLAVGVAGDLVKGKTYAGSVRVLYGTADGLTAAGDELFTEATKGVPGKPQDDDQLGDTLAVGDFDNDGRDDLAAGLFRQDTGGKENSGAAIVFSGSGSGLRAQGAQLWSEDSKGIAGKPAPFDEFSHAMAAGDFDGDNRDDLAAGVPFDVVDGIASGTVRVIFGSGDGLSRKGDLRLHEGQPGIVGDPEDLDGFGSALASGRIDPGDRSDLAIGIPTDGADNAGSVTVLFGSGSGPSGAGDQSWSQDTPDVEGVAGAGDFFGQSVALGDFDDNGLDDLAVGVPGDDVGAFEAAGAVNVLYAEQGTLTAFNDQLFNQATSGMLGIAENADQFGTVVATGNFDGADGDELSISVEFDDAGAQDAGGSVAVLPGLDPGGLDTAADQLWNQASPEIESDPTSSEFFGHSLAAGS